MTFQYTYSAPVNKEVEQIRNKYLPQEVDKFSELKKLDYKVQSAGIAESLAVGIIGCLIFGIAMCMGLDVIGGGMIFAVFIGIIGVIVMLPAYPWLPQDVPKGKREIYTRKSLRLPMRFRMAIGINKTQTKHEYFKNTGLLEYSHKIKQNQYERGNHYE